MSSTATLVLFQSWAKIQPKLRELYNGPDALFLQTASCVNCGLVAVDASDCSTCHKLVCHNCLQRQGQNYCKNCNTSLETVSQIHPVEQAMFQRATFACVYRECSQRKIPYKDYQKHVVQECSHRLLECLNKCLCQPFSIDQEQSHRMVCPNEMVPCIACKNARVPRALLKSHLLNDCTNRTLSCNKCLTSYDASEDHCCITVLRHMIGEQAAIAADDREHISNTFSSLADQIQGQLQLLDHKIQEQQNDTTRMLDAIVALNSQVASFQTTKLDEIAQSMAQRHSQSKPLDIGLVTFSPQPNFQLQTTFNLLPVPAGARVECRKIPIQGAQSGHYFEYPELFESQSNDGVFFCAAEFEQKLMSHIYACSGVGIYSVRLQYDDGSKSPLFGSRAESTSVDVRGDEVTAIGVRAWKENYVQTVSFKMAGAGSTAQASIESQSSNGAMKEFKLESGERVIGVHGFLDQNQDLRGFGFIVMKVRLE